MSNCQIYVLLLNNRTVAYYDFEELCSQYGVSPILVMNRPSYDALAQCVKEQISNVHVLEMGDQKAGPTYTFPLDAILRLYETERKHHPDIAIVASDEMSAMIAAQVREVFHLPGSSLSLIELYRDKIAQKKRLQKAGLKIPAFQEIDFSCDQDILAAYEHLTKNLGEGFIIKPALSSATVGVTRIWSLSDLEGYAQTHGALGVSIAERFIQGQLHHIDFIVQGGRYLFEEVCEYVWNGLSFVGGKNHGSLMLEASHPLRETLLTFGRRANDVLGLQNGCVHMEVFVTPKGDTVFLEAGPRPAGSLVPGVYTKAYGRSFMNAALLAELGISQEPFSRPKSVGFWGLFPKVPGRVVARLAPEMTSPHSVEWFVEEGDVIPQSTSIAEKAGHMCAFNENHAQLRQDFESLRHFQALAMS